MFSLLETIAKLASSQFNKDLPPAIDSIKRDPVKGILSTAYDIAAPVTVQAALYSPEAEAAFIGPQGMKRLQAAGMGDRVKEFTSRFFGQRGEINPTDTDLVIQSMMGGPHSIAKAKTDEWAMWKQTREELASRAKAYPKSAGLQEALAKHNQAKPEQLVAADFLEHFPELVTAYPRLKKVPVNFYESSGNMRYLGKYDPEGTTPRATSALGAGRIAEDAFHGAMGTTRSTAPEDVIWRGIRVSNMARKRAKIKAQEERRTGDVTVVGQENASTPGLDSYNTLLHEIQHFIQREESGLGGQPGGEFLDLYTSQAKTQPYNYDKLVDKVGVRKAELRKNYNDQYKLADAKVDAGEKIIREKQASGKLSDSQASKLLSDIIDQANKQEFKAYSAYTYAANKYQHDRLPMNNKMWDYKMNPFEREAYESARRDTDPGYRKSFARKTEQLKIK